MRTMKQFLAEIMDNGGSVEECLLVIAEILVDIRDILGDKRFVTYDPNAEVKDGGSYGVSGTPIHGKQNEN